MVSRRRRGSESKAVEEEGGGDKGGGGQYEESRAQRIKENMERMKSLGIADLSKHLKRPSASPSLRKIKPQLKPSHDPPRRSSRLKDAPRPVYSEKRSPKKAHISSEKAEIHIPAGEKPEIYTEEHEKLVGDSVTPWTLLVDGFDDDGQRIYDPHEGKSCHQCRQKTLGLRTSCTKCSTVSGQFCGDCLYMRYGENVREVSLNPGWVCPVCRGICNCSRCRRDKGWNPTGAIYRKAVKLGFKSVAHYLIQTRREGAIESPTGGSCSVGDEKEGSSDALPLSGSEEHGIPGGMVQDSDCEFEGDEHDEEQDN
ncbi:cell division cycle-associated 7-like protein [Salvia divinorum]|uniref:Cell division cycle-associated 7-like protein n=1 Tax=Salvia divinorum TaxID=28513 RepID=A0ABD1FXJ1_SALDI